MKFWSSITIVLLVAAGFGLSAARAGAPESAQSGPAKLSDLAWLEGRWSGDALGGHCEEVWSGPSGGSMMGMFRLVAENKTSLFEFLVLEQSSSGVVLRFKHFSPGYQPWEKERALELVLATSSATSWTFESPDPMQSPTRMIYARPDTDKLIVTVETVREGRAPESFDVVLKRAK